jgi:hypothetical protein
VQNNRLTQSIWPFSDCASKGNNMTNEIPAEAFELFKKARAILASGEIDFPYDIEAELNDLCGEDEWLRAWDAYNAERLAA